jgi:AP-1-like factor
MAVSTFDDSNYDPSLYLNSNEQDLLLTALSSNKPQHNQAATLVAGTNSTPKKAGTNNSHQTPEQIMPGSNSLQDIGFDNSPFLDYELDESNFDWDLNGQMIGGLPGTSSNGSNGNDDDADDSASPDGESGDKRKSPDDQNEEDGGGKRREGDDKNNKKPGRKPLTSEPTTVSSLPGHRE